MAARRSSAVELMAARLSAVEGRAEEHDSAVLAALVRAPRALLASPVLPAAYTDLQHDGYYVPHRRIMAGVHDRLLALLEHRALWVIRHLFIPLCSRKWAKRKRAHFIAERKVMAMGVHGVVALLKHSEIFQLWPEKALQELAEGAVAHSFCRGEFVFYENEPSSSLAVLVRGAASAAARVPGDERKGFVLAGEAPSVRVRAHWQAPLVFGEYAVLAEELKPYVRAEDTCDVVFLPAERFVAMLRTLPPAVKAAISEASLRQKKSNMLSKSFSTDELLRSPYFMALPHDVVDEVVRHFQPEVLPRGTPVVPKGQFGRSIYYLLSGHCECFVDGDGGRSVIGRYQPGQYFGEFTNGQQEVATLSLCEFWVLHRTAAVNALLSKRDNKDADRIARHKRLRALQTIRGSVQDSIYAYALRNLPIFAALLDPQELRSLAALFEPEVYVPGDVILSRTGLADRLLVVTDGSPMKQDSGKRVRRGTFYGYTCLLVHKWTATLVAKDNVDAWRVARAPLVQFLKQRKKYELALRLGMLMLQPNLPERCLPPLPRALRRYVEMEKHGAPPARRSRASLRYDPPGFFARVLTAQATIRRWGYLFSGDEGGAVPPPPETLYDRLHPVDMGTEQRSFAKATVDDAPPPVVNCRKQRDDAYRFSAKTAAMHSKPKGAGEPVAEEAGASPSKKGKTVVFEAGTADPQGSRGGRASLASAGSQRTLKSSNRSSVTSPSTAGFDPATRQSPAVPPALRSHHRVSIDASVPSPPVRLHHHQGVRGRSSISPVVGFAASAAAPVGQGSLPSPLGGDGIGSPLTPGAHADDDDDGGAETPEPAAEGEDGHAAPAASPAVHIDFCRLHAAKQAQRRERRDHAQFVTVAPPVAAVAFSSAAYRFAARAAKARPMWRPVAAPVHLATSQRAGANRGGSASGSDCSPRVMLDVPLRISEIGSSADAASGDESGGDGSPEAAAQTRSVRFDACPPPRACCQPTPPPAAAAVHFHNFIPCALPDCEDAAPHDRPPPRSRMYDDLFSL